jgi:hypothetical protein
MFLCCRVWSFHILFHMAILTLYEVVTYEHCFAYDLVRISFRYLQWGGCALWE